MLANRVKDTTSTTGTGSFTTTGAVSGFQTFNTAFGTTRRFIYWAVNDTDSEWETGVGYLSASTTLVRETVLDNSSGGTSAINFTTAPRLLCGENECGTRFPAALPATSGSFYKLLLSEHWVDYTTTYTLRADQIYLTPFICSYKGLVSNWALYVKTASAGAVARMGIYTIDDATGLPTGDPWMESDDIDCGTTGLVTLAFSNNTVGPTTAQRLPDRFILALAFEDAVIQVQSVSYVATTKTWMPKNSNSAEPNLYQAFTLGTPTPASSALPTIGTLAYRAENFPIGGLS